MKNIKPKDMPLLEVDGKNIVLFHPQIPSNAANYVVDTLHSRWIGQGPKVDKFEKEFSKKFCNDNNCVSVGSGTDALHLSYILSDLKPGDEVVTPVFTCTATNIPFLYMGVKPVFADIQKGTLNIDPIHVAKLVNEKTKAIVCVHYGGLPCDMDEINVIAKKWNIPVIEDGAHAVGAKYKGKNIGAISDFTMFSFQAIKHITTGDGGMITTSNKNYYERLKRLRQHGMSVNDRDRHLSDRIINEDYLELGYNFRMTDIQAAVGITGGVGIQFTKRSGCCS